MKNDHEMSYIEFENRARLKIDDMSLDKCLDAAMMLCMKDFYVYSMYISANDADKDRFEPCERAFSDIMINRFCLKEISCSDIIERLNEFLEELQEEDGEYFDECVNTTCEIMHILAYIQTGDKRNIFEVFKLCAENAEAFLQKSGRLEDSECQSRSAAVFEALVKADFQSVSHIYDYINI